MIYNIPTTHALLDRLEADSALKRICDWERKNDVSDEWTLTVKKKRCQLIGHKTAEAVRYNEHTLLKALTPT